MLTGEFLWSNIRARKCLKIEKSEVKKKTTKSLQATKICGSRVSHSIFRLHTSIEIQSRDSLFLVIHLELKADGATPTADDLLELKLTLLKVRTVGAQAGMQQRTVPLLRLGQESVVHRAPQSSTVPFLVCLMGPGSPSIVPKHFSPPPRPAQTCPLLSLWPSSAGR